MLTLKSYVFEYEVNPSLYIEAEPGLAQPIKISIESPHAVIADFRMTEAEARRALKGMSGCDNLQFGAISVSALGLSEALQKMIDCLDSPPPWERDVTGAEISAAVDALFDDDE